MLTFKRFACLLFFVLGLALLARYILHDSIGRGRVVWQGTERESIRDEPKVEAQFTDKTGIESNRDELEVEARRSPYACSVNGTSLTDMAMRMARYSSAASQAKTRHVLALSNQFKIQLHAKIFSSVTKNVVSMMEGYGLRETKKRTIDSSNERVIIVENSYLAAIKNLSSCSGKRCDQMPRIVIQSEQERKGLPEYLQACHRSTNCVIWEFSDYNLGWQDQKYNISSSVLLIPLMIQNRMDHLVPKELIPIEERSIDVVFFGLMNARRNQLKASLDKELSNLTIVFGLNRDMESSTAKTYSDAKICLIVHSYGAQSAAEFHRLTDFSKFGCVPVVERFIEQIGIDPLTKCGGLVMADYQELVPTIAQVLRERIHFSDMASRTRWWNDGVAWSKLLPMILGRKKQYKGEQHENRNDKLGRSQMNPKRAR